MWRKMLVILAVSYSSAFNSPKPILVKPTVSSQQYDESSRRTFIATLSSVSLAIGSTLMQSLPVGASGGATAGGAYLLSAKQRYNDRVISGLKGFLALEPSLKAGSVEEAKAYFAGTQQGEFGDISTAGYLLANAFRRSSNTAPDALPSVKEWKAFAKELDGMQKKIKKKDAAGALESFRSAEEALDLYLSQVELPPVMELKKS